ncbi:MAG: CRTAC1 family protein [Phycisphaeraceae bacterium]|nr:MAG: CRTAC1 family protein [Phycisphaeraceae bacterium]
MKADMIAARAACCLLAAAGSAGIAAGANPFTEEAVARGINFPMQTGLEQWGMGLGLLDLDGDGDPDAVTLGASDGRVGLYENDGTGHFTDRTYDFITPRIAKHPDYAGLSAADFDGDGDLDLYFSRAQLGAAPPAPNLFYRNDGDWQFTEIGAAAGVADTGYTSSTCWGDYNGDGWLDLYVCNRTATYNNFIENKLFENQGDGTFVDVAAAVGAQRAGDPTLTATFFDYEQDGDADLYLGTDKGSAGTYVNHFLRNDGGVYTDITTQTHTEAHIDCMGIALGDVTRDGKFDLYLTNLDYGNVLLCSEPDDTFLDRTTEAGMGVFLQGWGTMCMDYDNDTWEDVYVCNQNAGNSLFHHPGTFPLVDVASQMGVATPSFTYCAVQADIDNDGDMDIMTTEQFARVRLYINNEGSTRHWAKFNVVGQGHNTFGIGTRIRVQTDVSQIREMRAGHNYKAQETTTLHFGLADATSMQQIDVNWPNTGASRTLTGYPADQTWTLYPPERIGDIDLDGDVDAADKRAVLARQQANVSEPIVPGIEMLDADGDADFDYDDVLLIGLPCLADVAPPFGLLDLADISAFIGAFLAHDPIADMNGDGLYDLADLSAFVGSFLSGCP